jgi:hypothetical protein
MQLFVNVARRFRFSVKPASGYTKKHSGFHAITFTLEVLTNFVLEQPKINNNNNNSALYDGSCNILRIYNYYPYGS